MRSRATPAKLCTEVASLRRNCTLSGPFPKIAWVCRWRAARSSSHDFASLQSCKFTKQPGPMGRTTVGRRFRCKGYCSLLSDGACCCRAARINGSRPALPDPALIRTCTAHGTHLVCSHFAHRRALVVAYCLPVATFISPATDEKSTKLEC